jgi:hypothetical protein
MQVLRGSGKFYRYYRKSFVVLSIIVGLVGLLTSAFTRHRDPLTAWEQKPGKPDSAASVAAFMKVYSVLMSPRCMNCHPAGDVPLQGEDSHLHAMSPKRGKDGQGLYAMKCSNCHQPTNTPGLQTPPGNPKWALPPSEMKMVFQGKTARELALQIRDYNQNGHKNKKQLLEHARDTLVKAGWNMGEGRPAPPMSYNAFVKAWNTWIERGAYAPGK